MTPPIVLLQDARHFSHKAWKLVKRFDLRAGSRKKNRRLKKSQRRYTSLSWEEAPTETICTKICTMVGVPELITNEPYYLQQW